MPRQLFLLTELHNYLLNDQLRVINLLLVKTKNKICISYDRIQKKKY